MALPDLRLTKMNSEDKHKDGKTSDLPEEHTYHLLGESGLVEDEEGNIYNASDIYGIQELDTTPTSNLFTDLIKPSPMPDWAAIYDPRYCGPSREAYIDEMTKRYNERVSGQAQTCGPSRESYIDEMTERNNERVSSQPPTKSSTIIPGPIISSSESHTSPFSEQSPLEETSSSNVGQESSDSSGPNPDNKFKIRLSKRTVIFYIFGLIALVAYFVLLIIRLIDEVSKLF